MDSLPSILSDAELSDRLFQVLGRYGQIVNIKASRDGRGRPFAFVQFEGKVVDFLLTETVTIEDRVLRFERAKSTFNAHLQQQQQQQQHAGHHPRHRQILPHVHAHAPVQFFPQIAPIYPGFPPVAGPAAGPFIPIPAAAAGPTEEDSDDGSASSASASATASQQPVDQTSDHDQPATPAFKVFVGHLNGELITQRKLLRRFQRHGHITDIELFKRNLDGSPRKEAFAFISYLTEEQLFAAIREENDQVWLGNRIKCCKALPKRDPGQGLAAAMDYEVASTTEGTFYYPSMAAAATGAVFYHPYPPAGWN